MALIFINTFRLIIVFAKSRSLLLIKIHIRVICHEVLLVHVFQWVSQTLYCFYRCNIQLCHIWLACLLEYGKKPISEVPSTNIEQTTSSKHKFTLSSQPCFTPLCSEHNPWACSHLSLCLKHWWKSFHSARRPEVAKFPVFHNIDLLFHPYSIMTPVPILAGVTGHAES